MNDQKTITLLQINDQPTAIWSRLERFSHGDLTWAGAQQEIASSCDNRFASRLQWAKWMQRALFQPSVRSALVSQAAHSNCFWRGMFERTR